MTIHFCNVDARDKMRYVNSGHFHPDGDIWMLFSGIAEILVRELGPGHSEKQPLRIPGVMALLTDLTRLPTRSTALVVAEREAERARLRDLLEAGGLAVLTADRVAEADRLLSVSPPDLIVVDVQGGRNDPLSLCRRWGDRSRTRLVILSDSQDPIDQIVALELGADLLVPRPFDDRLLMAKVRALLRRMGHGQAVPAEDRSTAGIWSLNAATREVCGPSGRRVSLAPGDVAMLHLFMSNPGLVFTSESATVALGSRSLAGPLLRMSISRLRRKLIETGDPDPIRNVRGVGYVYEPEVLRPVAFPLSGDDGPRPS
ncbi:MAG: response regulator transcription factor [Caulobacteraceae bacterium]|nr:response regulator transcription factor [Caulobacteraceae bacterium]